MVVEGPVTQANVTTGKVTGNPEREESTEVPYVGIPPLKMVWRARAHGLESILSSTLWVLGINSAAGTFP